MIDTRLIVNSLAAPPRDAHENNVIGTMNILAACTGADSPVRKFIFKSSTHYYGSEQDDPAFFTEQMRARTRRRRRSSATSSRPRRRSPTSPTRARRSTVTVLRCANVLGPDVDTGFTRMFSLPVVPMVLGFDPRLQFIHEDDIVHALEHAALNDDPGHLQRRRRRRPRALGGDRPGRQAPAAGAAAVRDRPAGRRRCAGSASGSPTRWSNLLRFGRGVDNRLYKATGFDYGYTSRETVAQPRRAPAAAAR